MVANNHYKTSDTALASFLITKNYNLVYIDYEEPRYKYHFDDSPQIRELANSYIIGNALAEPISYARVYKKLNRVIRKHVQWEDD